MTSLELRGVSKTYGEGPTQVNALVDVTSRRSWWPARGLNPQPPAHTMILRELASASMLPVAPGGGHTTKSRRRSQRCSGG